MGFSDVHSRLFRHDCRIVANTIRNEFEKWSDRWIAAILLITALAAMRSWFAYQPWTIAAWTMLGAAIVVGIGAGRFVVARLNFHCFDGLLAANALLGPTRRRYIIAWHCIGIALVAAVALIARPSLVPASVIAYGIGAIFAGLTARFGQMPISNTGTRTGWTARSWLLQPGVGIAAAVVMLVSLLPTVALGMKIVAAIVGIGTLLIALSLTIVDDAVVRFMTIAGHGSLSILGRHMKSIASFVAVAVLGCWLMIGRIPAAVVAAVSAGVLLLTALRILAYRLFAKRPANFLISIIVGFLALVTYALPPASPFVAMAILWQLQRRGSARIWLLS
jgi:hypothetical protein